MNFQTWLAGQVVVVALAVSFWAATSSVGRRAEAAKSLAGLQKNTELFLGLWVGLILADLLAVAVIGVRSGGAAGWIVVVVALVLGAWVMWNWPPSRRTIVVDAQTDFAGDPYQVSAFFADVGDWGRWQTDLISCVEAGLSARGPRFHQVGVIPGTNRRIEGDVVLKVNEPGKEVTVGVEGAGGSADQFLLSPIGTGTHVLNREVLEVPFILALIGGMFFARDKDRSRRHMEELLRAKVVFEATHNMGV